MKKSFKILMILIVILVFMFGCSGQSQIQDESVDDRTNSNDKLETDVTTKSSESDIDKTSEPIDENLNTGSATMRYCYSKAGEPVVYTYYIADNAVYVKTATSEDGDIEKVTTEGVVCTRSNLENYDSWNCIPGKSLADEKEVAELQTTGMMGDMFGFKCETIPYDATIFETSDE